jgi:hypothetical protein
VSTIDDRMKAIKDRADRGGHDFNELIITDLPMLLSALTVAVEDLNRIVGTCEIAHGLVVEADGSRVARECIAKIEAIMKGAPEGEAQK